MRFFLLINIFLIIIPLNKTYSQSSKTDSLILRFEQSTDNVEKGKIAFTIASLNEHSDSATFLKYTELSLHLSEQQEDAITKGRLYLLLGYYYCDRDMLKALDYANKSLDTFIESDSIKYEALAYTLLGTVYYYCGNYSKSFEYYLNSLKINEKLNLEKNLSSDYNNLAIIYIAQNNPAKALEYFFKALAINKKYNSVRLYCSNLMNISNIYIDIDSVDQGLKYGLMALNASKKLPSDDLLSHILFNQGCAQAKKGEFAEAQKNFAKAESIFIKNGDKYYLYYLYYSEGCLYCNQKKPEKAIELLKRSFTKGKEDGILQLVQESSYELSKVYKSLNQLKESLYYYEIYHSASDSIFNDKKAKKITELELQYNFDKQMEVERIQEINSHKVMVLQRNIITFSLATLILTILLIIVTFINYRSSKRSNKLLSEQNAQIKKQHDAIKAQSDELRLQRDQLSLVNATKDKLYSIIAHDLKNPFNVLLGFTNLLTERWSTLNEEKKLQYIHTLNESATNASELLQNLLEWSRSQTGTLTINPECICIKDFVDKTIQYVSKYAEEKNISILNQVSPSVKLMTDGNMIGIVLRNLITNAIKFTKENGTVKIWDDCSKDGVISLVVEDNGIGISGEGLKKLFNIKTLFSTVGTNNEKGTGLGLLLCKEYVEKNNGTIDVESQVGVGTKFTITLNRC